MLRTPIAILLFGLVASTNAKAASIDLYPSPSIVVSNFTEAHQYAQSITALGNSWDSLSFSVRQSALDPVDAIFDLYIAEAVPGTIQGNEPFGVAPDPSNILFQQRFTFDTTQSPTLTGTRFDVDLGGLSVDIGKQYFFVLDGVLHRFGALMSETNVYGDGLFLFKINAADDPDAFEDGTNADYIWSASFGDRDLIFNAEFSNVSTVPLPAALPLLATAFAGLGFIALRCKRSST